LSNLVITTRAFLFALAIATFALSNASSVNAQVAPIASAPFSPLPFALQSNVPACPSNASSLRGTGRSMRCRCSRAASTSGSVWGSGTYTDDSRICRAAVHAGVISSNGGIVTIQASGGLRSYAGSNSNGVTSGKWGSFGGSFRFSGSSGGGAVSGTSGNRSNRAFCPSTAVSYRGSGRTITCSCSGSETRGGSVWGTGTYTDDSKICRAAMHAGIIGLSGGNISFRMVGPRNSYRGSSANSVNSGNYGAWRGSFQFANNRFSNGGAAQRAFCPANAAQYRASGRTVECRCSGSETRAGSVWGSGTYTDDSKICRAAVHAGVIGNTGGLVRFRMVGGLGSYRGSSRNGVSTGKYGSWNGSYVFVPY
jgi:LCCL domain